MVDGNRCARVPLVVGQFHVGRAEQRAGSRGGGEVEVELVGCIGSRVVVVDVVDDRVEVAARCVPRRCSSGTARGGREVEGYRAVVRGCVAVGRRVRAALVELSI